VDVAEKLGDRLVKALGAPESGSKITYDSEVAGFAVRVTASGARAFILRYRFAGRSRLLTIGSFPDWSTTAARDEATRLKRRIDLGEDPMGERHDERAAPTVSLLIDTFKAEHLPKRRPATVREYAAILDKIVRPELGAMKVRDVTHADVERLHRRLSARTPFRANRTAAVISKMMSFAIKREWRSDNPVKGLERNAEEARERYLTIPELRALAQALREHSDQRSANVIRFLLMTGARRGEVLSATWEMFDLETGVWVKPSSHTKQKRLHRVPLSAPALGLLRAIRAGQDPHERFVFPGDKPGAHLTDVKKSWAALTAKATVLMWAEQPETPAGALVARLRAQASARRSGFDKAGAAVVPLSPPKLPSLEDCRVAAEAEGWALPAGLADVRAHDLRHTYASILASGGASLPMIGSLLGHSQAATTKRYAHLFDDPLRAAAERVGVFLETAEQAEVVKIEDRR
jgi:integrase